MSVGHLGWLTDFLVLLVLALENDAVGPFADHAEDFEPLHNCYILCTKI